jgi:hypothetical protein
LHGHIHIIFDDSLVDVADNRLYDAELLKELAARVEDLLREDVFLPVDPKVGEALLRRV